MLLRSCTTLRLGQQNLSRQASNVNLGEVRAGLAGRGVPRPSDNDSDIELLDLNQFFFFVFQAIVKTKMFLMSEWALNIF